MPCGRAARRRPTPYGRAGRQQAGHQWPAGRAAHRTGAARGRKSLDSIRQYGIPDLWDADVALGSEHICSTQSFNACRR